jgi:hypothetical protein
MYTFKVVLTINILLIGTVFVFASEKINDNCYKFEKVFVCDAKNQEQKTIPQIEQPKKDDEIIVTTSFEYGDENYSDKKICEAIWFVEGQEKANQYYGINPQYVKCENRLECYNVCINTVKHKRTEYQQYGYEKFSTFLEYLASRYCPINQKVWLKNLKFYLEK